MKCFFRFLISTFVLAMISVNARRDVTEYVIDLDLAPEMRYEELLPRFNVTVWVSF